MATVNTTPRGVRTAAALAAALPILIGVTSCASDAKSSSTVPSGNQQASAATSPPARPPGSTPAGGADGGSAPAIDLTGTAGQDRYLAIDITYGIEVGDIGKGIDGVVALTGRHHGQIYERTINIADDRSSTASFVVKLPPDQVDAAIADLDTIGDRRTASQGTEDVTAQVVDIDARLTTARASLDRVRKLLESATDLGQVLSLESQLTERETTVEQYEATKRALDERVSLATLRINLSVGAETAPSTGSPRPRRDHSIGRAFRTGGHAFVIAAAAVMIFIGYTAPFLVLGALATVIVVTVLRRRRRRRAGLPPPPAAGAQPDTRPSQPVGVST